MADINSPAMMVVDPNTLRMPHPIGDGKGQLIQAIRSLPVKGKIFSIEVDVPGVLAAAAYTANDQVGEMFPIPLTTGFEGWLDTVVLFETTTNSLAADLFIFDEGVVNAVADNSAVSITDALMRRACIGFVRIVDYAATAVNSIGESKGSALAVKTRDNESALYGLLVTRGAPTYAVGGINLKFKFTEA